jgi:peptidyl-prolyl cis-trans isomerase C
MTRLIIVLLFASMTSAAAQERDLVLAEGAGIRITLSEFQQWLEATRAQGGYLQRVTTLTPEGQQRIFQTLIDQRLFAAAAREAGLDRDLALASENESVTASRLAARHRDRVLGQSGEGDLRAYYAANADKFRSGARVKARHILVKTREEAMSALAEIRSGTDFAELAGRISIDATSRRAGGDLGWVGRGVMVRPFDEALFSLAAGQLSDVIQTGFGFHIITVDEVDRGALAPFDAIRAQVVERVSDELIAAERTRLIARYGLTIHQGLLQRGAK